MYIVLYLYIVYCVISVILCYICILYISVSLRKTLTDIVMTDVTSGPGHSPFLPINSSNNSGRGEFQWAPLLDNDCGHFLGLHVTPWPPRSSSILQLPLLWAATQQGPPATRLKRWPVPLLPACKQHGLGYWWAPACPPSTAHTGWNLTPASTIGRTKWCNLKLQS